MAVKTLADAAPDEVRFAEPRRRMPGVSQKKLSVTLRGLTRDGTYPADGVTAVRDTRTAAVSSSGPWAL
ncbi:hypothetical protein GCM10010371_56320 [Streptomyces subrutilus]|uniref:Uncharacterized protein n=1 Tax=Streptomyces subrutilus TaxID=36818 RepID=A0A918VCG3_9ACTN|nr:hypothetical protein GCM10010371_56320 [Streptomyces subrutilus]